MSKAREEVDSMYLERDGEASRDLENVEMSEASREVDNRDIEKGGVVSNGLEKGEFHQEERYWSQHVGPQACGQHYPTMAN